MSAVGRPFVEWLAAALHAVHGTRGLLVGGLGLLALGLIDPLLPADISRIALVLPIFIVLVAGAATLAREGVAVQQRARSLAHADHGARRLASVLVWPAALCILLAPRIFLAAYGVPHLNPLTGVILPAAQQRLTILFLFLILLVAVVYLRSTRRYARHILPKRPRDLSRADRSHQERDGLLWMGTFLLVAYAWLLHSFWQPFSLLHWPPGLESLSAGARGVASISFSLALPLILFHSVAGHAGLLGDLVKRRALGQDHARTAAVCAHILLSLGAAAMHAYDLLWIAQYRAAVPF